MATTPSPDSAGPSKQDDWHQKMADVKRHVEALHSLMPSTSPANHEPKPQPEPETKPRKFIVANHEMLTRFQLKREKMRGTLFDVLIDLFRWIEEVGNATEFPIPSFTDELTLLVPNPFSTQGKPAGTQELKRFDICIPFGKARLKKHILSGKLGDWNLYNVWPNSMNLPHYMRGAPHFAEFIVEPLSWVSPVGGNFDLTQIVPSDSAVTVGSGDRVVWWQLAKVSPGERIVLEKGLQVFEATTRSSDFGALCLLQTPIRDSILEFKWLEFILAQAGFLDYESPSSGIFSRLPRYAPHLASVLFFLGMFAGHWSSGAERALFSSRVEILSGLAWNYAQLHFRYFVLGNEPNNTIGSGGLLCVRQRGQITSSTLGIVPLRFDERRISIFGALTAFSAWDAAEFPRVPSLHRVLILAENDLDFPFGEMALKDYELKFWPGFGGSIAFQSGIFLTVKIWEKEWNKVLDKIDDCLRFQLNETMETKKIAKWMFDLDFERSRLYFTILQILRIFGECIRTVSMDLRALDNFFP
ncbi:hypothetical protein L207DRAFT_42244 [Hyaloscypha variabilis F]|uniref:Uncharacterized protein n=1 Tax=Hyaloscypha variabilis (strain UAMH 11265 / GT02V1 / F) TaxID=1149755 RepID=A0A2J6RJH0_HYAVF|nr:hypothetical protein L207DRAFT_42244 [Hyaloscypha variabilis F]